MATLAAYKNVHGGFSNASEVIRVKWDFSEDGGAVGDFDVLVAQGAVAVKFSFGKVVDAVTSGGLLTVDLGKGSGGTEFLSGVAVASLTANSLQAPASAGYIKLADGEKIVLGLNVAAATAGSIEMCFEVMKF